MTHTPHSPLPWHSDGFIGTLGSYQISTDDHHGVASLGGPPGSPVVEANAALIVTAVNSHATLLSALEQLLGAQLTTKPGEARVIECFSCARWRTGRFKLEDHAPGTACGRAAAAIAQAKGEAS